MSKTSLTHLNVFAGKWLTNGQQHQSAVGPAAKITAVETYEWLPGECFLIHRFDGRVGDDPAVCLEVIGRDAANEDYPVHTYYHNGVRNEWRLHERDGAWLLTGKWDIGGKPTDVRCTLVFSEDGEAMESKWEYADGGHDWHAFWEIEARKVKP